MMSTAFQTKASAVYTDIRQQILDGRLAAGTTINQEQLAEALGVSTTPVREALRRLESEGLVRAEAHRDVLVAPLESDNFRALYAVRMPLDGMAARLAAENHTPADADEMNQAVAALRSGGDSVRLNRRLHRSIYAASHNPILVELLDSVWDRCDRYRHLAPNFMGEESVIDEHEALVAVVLSGNPDEAEAAVLKHVSEAREVLEHHISASLSPAAPAQA